MILVKFVAALLKHSTSWRCFRELLIRQKQLHEHIVKLKDLAGSDSDLHPSLCFKGCPWTPKLICFGNQCIIEEGVMIWLSEDPLVIPSLHFGNRVFIGKGAYIGCHCPINIGDNTIIGAYSYIVSANHRADRRDMPIRDQGFVGAPINIEADVWIGTHVVILPGVNIGNGAIVGAGSIVNRTIPPYQVWGGVPARFIKNRA